MEISIGSIEIENISRQNADVLAKRLIAWRGNGGVIAQSSHDAHKLRRRFLKDYWRVRRNDGI